MSKLVHLIYVHGFQGNDTTFQAFPTDLQQFLNDNIPSHLDLCFQSSLYPTYKSAKPISYATKNFLEWLQTQPPGPVILLGHSMGGLLVADAATHVSNNPDLYPGAKPRRIMGVIAFDTPYLGMHPHVIISGISSLFPKDKNNATCKSVTELNPREDVKMVQQEVTENWEACKESLNVQPKHSNIAPKAYSNTHLSAPLHTSIASPSPTTAVSPFGGNAIPSPSHLSRSTSPLMDRTLQFLSSHADEALIRWIRKHSDNPFGAGKRWVVEHFQFGACMFDPAGLQERYARLVKWQWQGGRWINYWSQSPKRLKPKRNVLKKKEKAKWEESKPALPSWSSSENSNVSQVSIEFSQAIERRHDEKHKQGHHFIILPNGFGSSALGGGFEKWEKVLIEGVEDEVAAHCGLFIRGQNLCYDGFVRRVGSQLLDWCPHL